ncbi:RNA recognition motif containing protein [Musa troglodytarum]|uniref:RNA recognition motif containing protein n=1 Tax=Musa troglodytarum TaxID=320322 RepID=A0A9E7H928_9LILI|nr:RNA recognition motif containing protein [Musa troglodytarum]
MQCVSSYGLQHLNLSLMVFAVSVQTAVYNPQMASYYHQQLYGPTSPPTVGHPPYQSPHIGYLQIARAGFPSHYMQYPALHMEGTLIPSSSQQYPFQLQPPPHARQPLNTTEGQLHSVMKLLLVPCDEY